MWQDLRTELRPQGLEVVTIALDARGSETAGPWIVKAAADALRMPLVHDAAHGLWALGAEAGPRALQSAIAPELVLPDFRGGTFRLSSLRGTKVLLVAWASW